MQTKASIILFLFFIIIIGFIPNSIGQIPERIKEIFPSNAIIHNNIAYASDTLKKHLLDIYLPANAKAKTPLVVWIHGGAWMTNDKFADMGYMKATIKSIVESGYALASIDYRFSTTAVFPAQIQDCNQALEFLYQNADKYLLDRDRITLAGFSAGAHLACLMGLANNNEVKEFTKTGRKPSYKVKSVIDFYGPSDLVVAGIDDTVATSSLSRLLGALPIERPDLARKASPVTYVDNNDPPFLIIHGEKDESVPYQLSILLQSYLKLNNIKNDLIIVKGAPHYGVMFDSDEIRSRILSFLKETL